MHNLQRKIHMLHPLVDTARAHHVHIRTRERRHVTLLEPPADLDQEAPPPPFRPPHLLEPRRDPVHFPRREII